MVTAGADKMLKVFDVANFDLIMTVPTEYVPNQVQFVSKKSSFSYKFVVSESEKANLFFYKEDTLIKKVPNLLENCIKSLSYNPQHNILVAIDILSNIEYLDLETYDFPANI